MGKFKKYLTGRNHIFFEKQLASQLAKMYIPPCFYSNSLALLIFYASMYFYYNFITRQ